MSGAGDIDGDGFDDLLVGATGADPNGTSSGTAYVIYGEATTHLPALLTHLVHGNRHLGMIEAQRGSMGLRGTASL